MSLIDSALMISPVDSRYYNKVCELSRYFSDFALVKARLKVEIDYFVKLRSTLDTFEPLSKQDQEYLKKLKNDFSLEDFYEIQKIEQTINHDVKALEVFLRQRIVQRFGVRSGELVHFGLTSQDINDVAIPYLLKSAAEEVMEPMLVKLVAQLDNLAEEFKSIVFVARTHGQPASPSSLGKEFKVFAFRLQTELNELRKIQLTGKFGGATGNFNAHILTFPNVDWIQFSEAFLKDQFGLVRSEYTTQINNLESKSRMFDSLSRICGILQDLAQDIWLYLMMGLLSLKTNSNEVGSSAMPHKVNPIDFENAEGNLQMASSIFTFLSRKLLVSRLQRDLTDYTLKRNIGVPIGHMLLSMKKLNSGLEKVIPHLDNIQQDNEKNFIVVAEGIQSVLRIEGVEDSYNKVKDLVRGKSLEKTALESWIDDQQLSASSKEKLKAITPETYSGNSTCL